MRSANKAININPPIVPTATGFSRSKVGDGRFRLRDAMSKVMKEIEKKAKTRRASKVFIKVIILVAETAW